MRRVAKAAALLRDGCFGIRRDETDEDSTDLASVGEVGASFLSSIVPEVMTGTRKHSFLEWHASANGGCPLSRIVNDGFGLRRRVERAAQLSLGATPYRTLTPTKGFGCCEGDLERKIRCSHEEWSRFEGGYDKGLRPL